VVTREPTRELLMLRSAVRSSKLIRRGIVLAAFGVLCCAQAEFSCASEDERLQDIARQMIEVRDLSGASIGPDRKGMVVRVDEPDIGNNTTHLTWYFVPLLGSGAPRAIADGGEPIWDPSGFLTVERPQWSGDSRWVYFRALKNGGIQVWRALVDGSKSEQITSDLADVGRYVPKPDSSILMYEVRAERSRVSASERDQYLNGVRLDGTVDLAADVLDNFSFNGRKATIRSSKERGDYMLLDSDPLMVKVLDADTSQAREATPEERREFESLLGATTAASVPAGIISPQMSQISGRVVYLQQIGRVPTDVWRDPPPTFELRVATDGTFRDFKVCPSAECRGGTQSGARWRNNGREVVFASERPWGDTSLMVWDVERDTVRTIRATEGLLGADGGAERFHSGGCPLTDTEAICTSAEPSSPPQLEAINLETGQARLLFDPNVALRHSGLARTTTLIWKDKWGRTESGKLLVPNGYVPGTRLPLVITSYRCTGFLRGGTGADVPEQLVVASGMAALCVNFDSHLLFSTYPSKAIPRGQATHLQWNLDAWHSAIDTLVERGLVDPTRVGVSGLSFGAEAVHYAISHSHRFAAAAASQPPFTDPITYYYLAPRGEYGKAMLKAYGLPPPDSDSAGVWKHVSTALNVSRISAPLLIQTSSSEFRLGLQLYSNMVLGEKPIEFFVFPDEAHQFMQPIHRLVRARRNLDWFRFWLQGKESDAAALSDEVQRWRRLSNLRTTTSATPR
jgi:dienelactone hydrolase